MMETKTFDELEKRVRTFGASRLGIAPNMVGVDWVSIVIQVLMTVLQSCGVQRTATELKKMVKEKPVFARVAFWLRASQMDLKSMGIKPNGVVDCCIRIGEDCTEAEINGLLNETLDLRI